jgi:hypothetical protein
LLGLSALLAAALPSTMLMISRDVHPGATGCRVLLSASCQLQRFENGSARRQCDPKRLDRCPLSELVEDPRKRSEDRMPVALRKSGSPRPSVRVAGLTWSQGPQIAETRRPWHQLREYDRTLFHHCSERRAIPYIRWFTISAAFLVADAFHVGVRSSGAGRRPEAQGQSARPNAAPIPSKRSLAIAVQLLTEEFARHGQRRATSDPE